MKIIDLLNKIANGEEVPKKIKYKNIIWYFYKKNKTYYMNNTEIELFYIEKIIERLNDEVEIIEEEKKIPEKLPEWATSREDKEYTNDEYHCLVVARKVDEIIDYLKSKGDE